MVPLKGLYALDQRSSSHLKIKIRPHATMQALLRLTTFVSTVQGVRFACTGLADWCGKYSLFDGRLFGSNARISKVARNRAWVAGGWRTSTSSRSAESVDREWEEVRIGWARVEERGFRANVNSHRVSSKGSSISTKQIFGTCCNQSEMGRYTRT